MDLSNFKEILINGYKNLHNSIVNSSAFYFLKEKYDHLNPLYRKIIHTTGLLCLACTLLYYPFSNLYFSWKNMRDFKAKNTLSRDLMNLSIASSFNSPRSHIMDQDPVRFIRQKIPTLKIPKNQIEEIKTSRPTPIPENLSLPVKIETVAVKIKNLTLKEVVQYGRQMEQMSKSIKLMDIHITENPKKTNYFDVSYILSFFNLTKKPFLDEKQKSKRPKPIIRNKKLKPINDNTPLSSQRNKEKEKTTSPSSHFLQYKSGETENQNLSSKKKLNQKKPEPLLMDLKKENIPKNDTAFKNQPSEVKRKDLLPKTLPVKHNNSTPLPPPQPLTPPRFNNSPTPSSSSQPSSQSPKHKLPDPSIGKPVSSEKSPVPSSENIPKKTDDSVSSEKSPVPSSENIPPPPAIDNVSPSSQEEPRSSEQ